MRCSVGTQANQQFRLNRDDQSFVQVPLANAGTIAGGHWIRVRVVMNLAAGGGSGLGSVFVQNLTTGAAGFTAVTGLQEIPLALVPNAVDATNPTRWGATAFHVPARLLRTRAGQHVVLECPARAVAVKHPRPTRPNIRRVKPSKLSRRSFLRSSAAIAVAPLVMPRWTSGSPLATLNVACIGVGGMGGSDLASVAGCRNVRIAALCDVDRNHLGEAAKKHAGAATFSDFRVLFDKIGKDIDAVVVSTPDHMHAAIAIAAMQRSKHVYCQKPIAHNLYECRRMTELAREHGLVTQMGTQIHAHAAYRTAVATLRSGVLGRIREAHLWVGKSWAGPAAGRPAKNDPVPESLDWDLWLGVAPERPYVRDIYHPANWRGWIDFGSGTLGDMGCHIFDPVFTALGLGAPLDVVSRGPRHHAETFAGDGDVLYTFPGTDRTVKRLPFRWTDGDARPDAAKAQLPKDGKLPGSGSFVVGEKGVMVLPHWAMPSFYSDGEVLEVDVQEEAAVNHYAEWTDACRGEGATSTPFSYAGPLTEAVLLGTVAGRFANQRLAWDSDRLRFDHDAANALVRRSYREGWEID